MKKIEKILLLLIIVCILGGGVIFYMKNSEASAEEEKKISAEELAARSIDTDVITTNLASENNYAVVQFNILFGSEKAKEETEKRTPEVRAAVISTIAGFTKEQLIGKEGISTLEQELTRKLDEIVNEGRVERVLVTEFKLQ